MEQRDIFPQPILKNTQPTITFSDVEGDYQKSVDFLVSKGIKGKHRWNIRNS